MKQKILLLSGLIILAALLSSTLFTGNDFSRERLLSQIIYRGLEGYHYSGQKIDNEFSEKAFAAFLKYQDPNKRFLLKSDIEKLQQYKDKIDDEFIQGDTELMKLTTGILEQRTNQVIGLYEEILAQPFDFTVEESLEFDADKRDYCSNLTELKERWRKLLKYQTMLRYINLLKTKKTPKNGTKDKNGKNEKNEKNENIKNNTAANDTKNNEINEKELEKTARNAVLKSFKFNLNRVQQGNKNDALPRYINSVINVFDPHTIYFPPKEQEDFEMEMSGTFEGIGALLTEREGYVAVDKIIPGGPSWRQRELQAGDLILKVGQGDEEPEDIVGMRVVDAVKLIRGKKGTLVRLTVKRPDGVIKAISITRDVVVVEEAFARAAVLSLGDRKDSLGYIYLPKFYNDFTRQNGRNSTDDVKQELEKLNARNVAGIILDLRDNSGGSLQDAIRMSGLFIKEGPIVQVKSKIEDSRVYRDPDPGISYSGPLLVLINTLSASASEILAAALQDYNRAIIVGGAHSFGKGTVQVMLDLDNLLKKKPGNLAALGALTITIQKFYRIDGTSIQLRGISPDVVLPDSYDYFELGEKYYDNPLEWDTTAPAAFEKWTAKPFDIALLAKKSKERVEKNTGFQIIEEYIQRLKKNKLDTLQSLNLKKALLEEEQRQKESEELTKYRSVPLPIKVSLTEEIAKDTSARMAKEKAADQKRWIAQIRKDLVLYEAIAILNDCL